MDEKEAARKQSRRLPKDRAFHGHQSCHIAVCSIIIIIMDCQLHNSIQFNSIDPETPHAHKVRSDHNPVNASITSNINFNDFLF